MPKSPTPLRGAAKDQVDPQTKKFEDQALRLFAKGAKQDSTVTDPGQLRRFIDAVHERYGLERRFAQLQESFNAHMSLKDKDGARNLIKEGGKLRGLISAIDAEWDGSQVMNDGKRLPTAQWYMERVVVPATEKGLFESMLEEIAKAEGLDSVGNNEFALPDDVPAAAVE